MENQELQAPDLFHNVLPRQRGLVTNVFNGRGEHKTILTILAFFLDNKPKKKSDILLKGGLIKDVSAKSNAGAHSIYFSSLTRMQVIRYDSSTECWVRSNNFTPYLTYVISRWRDSGSSKLLALLYEEQIKMLNDNLDKVVEEMLADKATTSAMKTIWRGIKDAATDFILNIED